METLKFILFIVIIIAIILGVVFGLFRLIEWSNTENEKIHQGKKQEMTDCLDYWTSEGIEWSNRFNWCYENFLK